MLYYDLVALYFIFILLQPSQFEDVTMRGRLELFDKGMIDGFSILYQRLRGERKNPSGTTAHLSLFFFFKFFVRSFAQIEIIVWIQINSF